MSKRISKILFALALAIVLSSCSISSSAKMMESPLEGTTTGNALVDVEVGVGKLPGGLKAVSFCIDSIKLKKYSGRDVRIRVGEILFTGSDVVMSQISIPSGTYRGLSLELDDDCGNSVELENSHGIFATDEEIELDFDGRVVVGSNTQNLSLKLDSLVESLSSVDSDSEIESALEDSSSAEIIFNGFLLKSSHSSPRKRRR